VLVLWGDKFDEAPATIFVTALREAGLRVKVVGLTGRSITGAHGLALVPDLTLDQALALAGKAICVVIPYSSPGFKRFKNDPRILDLLHQARTNQAKFVVGSSNEVDITELGLWPASTEQVIIYPTGEELAEFAYELAGSLTIPI